METETNTNCDIQRSEIQRLHRVCRSLTCDLEFIQSVLFYLIDPDLSARPISTDFQSLDDVKKKLVSFLQEENFDPVFLENLSKKFDYRFSVIPALPHRFLENIEKLRNYVLSTPEISAAHCLEILGVEEV